MGGDFDHRWTQAWEAVRALKVLWTKDEAAFHSRYDDFPPVSCSPKAAHKPHPPVLLGGHAPHVLPRVARYADGWLPTRTTPGQVAASRKRLDTLAAERGRDPVAVTIAVCGQPPDTTRDQVDAFLNTGAVHVAVWPTHGATAQAMGEQCERMADALVRSLSP